MQKEYSLLIFQQVLRPPLTYACRAYLGQMRTNPHK